EKTLSHRRLERSNQAMEERIKESEQLHRFIVDHSPDLVYMLDRNGCFTFLNNRVESLLGYRKDELKGKHYSELIFEADLEAARNLFNERRTGTRATRNVELRMRSRRARSVDRAFQSQTVWMDLTAQGRYFPPDERTRENFIGTYGTARDISE